VHPTLIDPPEEDTVKRAIVAAGSAVVLTVGLGAWAITSQASPFGKKTFTLEGHQTTVQLVDQAPTGDSGGDIGVLAGDLTRDGQPAGKYQGYCVQIDTDNHSQCTFTYALPEGQLVIATGYGPGINADDVTQEPIVGGTGTYTKARGHAEGHETGQDTFEEVIRLED
jgi:hypothetical protein